MYTQKRESRGRASDSSNPLRKQATGVALTGMVMLEVHYGATRVREKSGDDIPLFLHQSTFTSSVGSCPAFGSMYATLSRPLCMSLWAKHKHVKMMSKIALVRRFPYCCMQN